MTLDEQFMTRWETRLARWVAYRPVTGSSGARRLARAVAEDLSALGFAVERLPHAEGEMLVARISNGAGPRLGLYGHYDVVDGGDGRLGFGGGRVSGRGVADNLGPLALRFEVLRTIGAVGSMVWVIEPGEETGSRALAAWLEQGGTVAADLWLDETGYFDATGDQRILTTHSDAVVERAVQVVSEVACVAGRGVRREQRRLRRIATDARSAVERLFGDRPYLALGPNDDASDVHGDSESLALSNTALAAAQFARLVAWLDSRAARS